MGQGLYSDDPDRDRAIGEAMVATCAAVGSPAVGAACAGFEAGRRFVWTVYDALPDTWKAVGIWDSYLAIDPWELTCETMVSGAVQAMGGGDITRQAILAHARQDEQWGYPGWDSGWGAQIALDETVGYFRPFGARTHTPDRCSASCKSDFAVQAANIYEAHRVGPLTRAIKAVDAAKASRGDYLLAALMAPTAGMPIYKAELASQQEEESSTGWWIALTLLAVAGAVGGWKYRRQIKRWAA